MVTNDIKMKSPISQASIDVGRRCVSMFEAFVHITTTVISGCIVTLFAYWLRIGCVIVTISK
ncbi:hypothetical protein BZ166_05060 [Staphylococcus cohnii]|nr:hypothetical protein BZ166_05060 [Staphylococcus cohnii]